MKKSALATSIGLALGLTGFAESALAQDVNNCNIIDCNQDQEQSQNQNNSVDNSTNTTNNITINENGPVLGDEGDNHHNVNLALYEGEEVGEVDGEGHHNLNLNLT